MWAGRVWRHHQTSLAVGGADTRLQHNGRNVLIVRARMQFMQLTCSTTSEYIMIKITKNVLIFLNLKQNLKKFWKKKFENFFFFKKVFKFRKKFCRTKCLKWNFFPGVYLCVFRTGWQSGQGGDQLVIDYGLAFLHRLPAKWRTEIVSNTFILVLLFYPYFHLYFYHFWFSILIFFCNGTVSRWSQFHMCPFNTVRLQWRQQIYPAVTWDTKYWSAQCPKLQSGEISAATVYAKFISLPGGRRDEPLFF